MKAAALLSLGTAAVAQHQPPNLFRRAQVWTCEGSSNQAWDLSPIDGGVLQIVQRGSLSPDKGETLVLHPMDAAYIEVQWNQTEDGVGVGWRFDTAAAGSSAFMWNATGTTLCLTPFGPQLGSLLWLQPCASPPSPNQQWSYNAGTGAIASAAQPGLCLDARTTINCSSPALSGYLYCNSGAATDDRVADLVARLDAYDLGMLLSSYGAGVPRLGVPETASTFAEALHGVWAGGGAKFTDPATGYTSSGNPTSFPHLLALSSSLNRSLWAAVADVVGTEAVGLSNQDLPGTTITARLFYSPDVNLFKFPTWGRGQEVPGEDPTLSAEFASIYSAALQGGPDSRYKRIVSTCKHSAAYDLEDTRPHGGNVTRFNFDASVTLQDLVRYYLPPFKACIQRAKSAAIMCSYNAINGVPACANGFLHNTIARGEYGFTGYIISDCGAFSLICSPSCYTYNKGHNYTTTLNETVAVAVNGGLDAACDPQFGPSIAPAVEGGYVTLSAVRSSASRLLHQVFALGIMDPREQVPYSNYGPQDVDTPAARQLALEAAVQSMVLLQNNMTARSPNGAGQPLLPLPRRGLARVAVVGPTAAVTQGLLSNYHGDPPIVSNQSVLQGIQRVGEEAGFTVAYAPGCSSIACPNTTGFPDAVAAAQGADVVVVVVGLCAQTCIDDALDRPWREEEMSDRGSLRLPGSQEALVQAMVATGVPVVVVLIHGGPLDIAWTKENVPAIVDAHYPGEMGGDAVAAVLFGDYSPAGRLTVTVYPEAFLSQRSITDMRLAPHSDPATGASIPGITHQFYAGETLWPFGWGLSYTQWLFTWIPGSEVVSVDAAAWASGAALPAPFAVNVTNVGAVASAVTAMAFLTPDGPGVAGQPLQVLMDFQCAGELQPGQSVTLFFAASLDVAAVVTDAGTQELRPGSAWAVRIGDMPGSPTGDHVTGRLLLTGSGPPVTLFDGPALLARSQGDV